MSSAAQVFPPPFLPVGNPRRQGGDARRLPVVNAGVVATGSMLAICALALIAVGAGGRDATSDGADTVPVIALLGIAVAVLRRHPGHHVTPVRGIGRSLALGIALAAAAVTVVVVVGTPHEGLYTGMAITFGLSAGYLLAWGYRSVALLRTVVLLSLLTWGPIANGAHTIVRSSLEQPSDLIYQRLAQLQRFGVYDEPWRIFTASLHRGSLVVIAAAVLAIAASRWRLSPRMFVDLGVTAAAALVAHHMVVLLSPIDVYDPSQADQVATQPTMEIAIAVIAVVTLGLVRFRRSRRGEQDTSPVLASATAADRDPVIFSSVGVRQSRTTTGLIAVGMIPLMMIVAMS